MHAAHTFLLNLAMVLSVAAVVTVLFQRFRLPLVLGYLLAGMVVGPHVPIPLVADTEVVNALSELGVILLMFCIGLEFTLRRLASVLPTGGLVALGEVCLIAWLGYQAGGLLGWSFVERLFTGALVAISSTSIIVKAFEEQRISGPLRDVTLSVLVVEDVLAILLMAVLGLVAGGNAVAPGQVAGELGRLGLSLGTVLAVGLLVLPRAFRLVQRLGRPETTVVAAVGACFAVALLVQELGYSVALGAFLAGMMVAESGHGHAIAHAVEPVRDVFAALFFVSVGMLIDPIQAVANGEAVLLLTGVVVVGKLVGVSTGVFLTGAGTRTAIRTGMSMTQIGEFSFIIASLGVGMGAISTHLYTVAVAVSILTAATTPLAVRLSDRVATWADHKLPPPLQTLSSIYPRGLELFRRLAAPGDLSARRRTARLLSLDVALLLALIVLYGELGQAGAQTIAEVLHIAPLWGTWLLRGATLLLATPLVSGVLRLSLALGENLVAPLIQRGRSGALPRVVAALVQLGLVLLVSLFVLLVSEPYLPTGPMMTGIVCVQGGLLLLLWRRAREMQVEVGSGARLLLDAMVSQAPDAPAAGLALVHHTLLLRDGDHAVGRSLVDLDLRARTGVTVVALATPGAAAVPPTGREPLSAGTALVLVGSEAAIKEGEAYLRGQP